MQGITDYGDYFDYGGIKVAKAGLSPDALNAYSQAASIGPGVDPNAAPAPVQAQVTQGPPPAANPQMLQNLGPVNLAPPDDPAAQSLPPQPTIAPPPRQSSGGGGGYSLNGMVKQFMQPLPDNAPMQRTYEDSIKAQQKLADSEANFQAAKANEMHLENINREQDLKKADERNKMIDETVQKKHDEINRLADTFANSKVDADAWWNSRSTGQKAMAGISIFLGGMGSALAGGENLGMRVIDDAIHRDIDAQKFNIEKAGKQIQLKREGLQDYRTTLKDEDERRQTIISGRYNMMLNKINELQTRTSSEEQQAKFDTLKAQIEQAKEQQNQTWAMQKRQVLGQQISLAASLQQAAAGGQKPPDIKDLPHLLALTSGDEWKNYVAAKNSYQHLQAARASGTENVMRVDMLANTLKQGSFGPEMLNLTKTLGFGDRVEDAVSSIITGKNKNHLKQIEDFITKDYLLKSRSMMGREQALRDASMRMFGRPDVLTTNPSMIERAQSMGIKRHGQQ